MTVLISSHNFLQPPVICVQIFLSTFYVSSPMLFLWPQQQYSPKFNVYLSLCFSNYGPQPQLSGSPNNFVNLLVTNSHYFDMRVKSSVSVSVIICSDTVAILTWITCYKNDTGHWLPGLPASQWKIIGFAKHNCRFSAKVTVRLARFEALWGIPRQSWKISNS
jgi:hypothetical protein